MASLKDKSLETALRGEKPRETSMDNQVYIGNLGSESAPTIEVVEDDSELLFKDIQNSPIRNLETYLEEAKEDGNSLRS